MASKAKRLSPVLVLILAILLFVVGAAAGFLGAARDNFLNPVDEYASIGKQGKSGADPPSSTATDADPSGSEIATSAEISGELQIHFLELGNYYTGDCVYIKAGDTDVLIDAGSKYSSVPTISAYLNQYVTDNKLEYVIVTHAHEDHYAGFAASTGIFDLYECEDRFRVGGRDYDEDPQQLLLRQQGFVGREQPFGLYAAHRGREQLPLHGRP